MAMDGEGRRPWAPRHGACRHSPMENSTAFEGIGRKGRARARRAHAKRAQSIWEEESSLQAKGMPGMRSLETERRGERGRF
jgi:hypothetical protein